MPKIIMITLPNQAEYVDMNIFQLYDNKIKKLLLDIEVIKNADITDALFDRINIEVPRDTTYGDISTNAAMVLSKTVRMAPRDLAETIIESLKSDSDIRDINIAGPGFINIHFNNDFWHRQLLSIIKGGLHYGKIDLGRNLAINIEYVSANPTGPMHVGHCRGAVVGDILANLLDFVGYKVTKEYYINDAGGQIDILAQSVFLRYKQALGQENIEISEGLYPGEYLIDVADKLAEQYGDKLLHHPNKVEIIKEFSVNEMMRLIKDDLKSLKVEHEVFFSEQTLHKNEAKKIKDAITDLTLKGYIYKGVLEKPKGHDCEDWESREQTLFRSTDVGDDQDRPLVKSDGSYTYFAADVAYLNDKIKRGYKQMIYILGADHSGYVKRLQALAKAFTGSDENIAVILCQLVKLMRNGEPVKMSKRAGNFVTLREVVDEVGCDPVRFMMVYRKNDAPLEFDFAKVTEQTKDNPVFYVQYAVARCHSIFRQAEELLDLKISDLDLESAKNNIHKLQDASEIEIIKKMAYFPQLIKAAAQHKEPHRLAFYLYDLASMFHSQWSKGNENQELRFVQKNYKEITLAKITLVKAVCNILTIGLNIMKVDAPEAMN